jgi:ribonuclease HI
MDASLPEFVLFSEANGGIPGVPASRDGWRFVLQSADGAARLEAADREPDDRGERLELLAVVRGLEALDQPSHVTLVTGSRYVRHGLVYGLSEWRENNWLWDRFGEFAPVKNADLWRRIDQALSYHTLVCRTWRTDEATGNADSETEAVAAAAHRDDDEFASESETESRRWPLVRNRLRRALNACRPRWAMAAATAQ